MVVVPVLLVLLPPPLLPLPLLLQYSGAVKRLYTCTV
jgi:hypothetical protein